jgi:hypothetical protein
MHDGKITKILGQKIYPSGKYDNLILVAQNY